MLRLFTLILGCLLSTASMAIHLDVAVSSESGKLKTDFCLEPAQGGIACDELPVLILLGVPPLTTPVDIETGKNIFVSDFNDFEGGPNAVDDPGFISGTSSVSNLPAGLRLSYEAVGQLQYWDPVVKAWTTNVPGSTRIELFGGIEVLTGPQCAPLLICFQPGSTLFSESGISGTPSLIVGDTNSSGVLHVHMDWFLEDSSNNPGGPDGAYMIEMKLTAQGYQDSESFFIMFAKELSTEQFGEALAARISSQQAVPAVQVPMPQPYIFILIMLLIASAIYVIRSSKHK